MSDYTPIPCAFYDKLTLLAMKKEPIILIPNFAGLEEGDYIKDIITTETKEEFIVMNHGLQIRLDSISNVEDNILFSNAFFEEE